MSMAEDFETGAGFSALELKLVIIAVIAVGFALWLGWTWKGSYELASESSSGFDFQDWVRFVVSVIVMFIVVIIFIAV